MGEHHSSLDSQPGPISEQESDPVADLIERIRAGERGPEILRLRRILFPAPRPYQTLDEQDLALGIIPRRLNPEE